MKEGLTKQQIKFLVDNILVINGNDDFFVLLSCFANKSYKSFIKDFGLGDSLPLTAAAVSGLVAGLVSRMEC